jgi:hypothetical protein
MAEERYRRIYVESQMQHTCLVWARKQAELSALAVSQLDGRPITATAELTHQYEAQGFDGVPTPRVRVSFRDRQTRRTESVRIAVGLTRLAVEEEVRDCIERLRESLR